jgi:hypothetical protein
MRILPKSNIVKTIIVFLFLLFCWTVYIEVFWIPVHRTVIDKKSRRLDVTGDGVDDEIRLSLSGKDWNNPIKWTLTVVSNGKIVFEHSADDAWLDKFFNDKGYVDDKCANYLWCKKQYYLEDMLKGRFTHSKPSKMRDDGRYWEEVGRTSQKELTTKFSLSAKEAETTSDWIIERLKTQNVELLNVPISPVQSGEVAMYVPRVKYFVIISPGD